MAEQRMGKDPFAKKKSLDWMASTATEEPISKANATIESLPKEEEPTRAGRPKTLSRKIEKSSQEGLPSGLVRATFIVSEDHLNKLKAHAYWERKTIKEVVSEAFANYLEGKNVEDIPCR